MTQSSHHTIEIYSPQQRPIVIFEHQRKRRENEELLPILPGAKAEPIVAAGELAVDLIHQRCLHHRRRQAPHRNLRPTKEIFHVIHPRTPLQFDWKLTPSLQDRYPRSGILEGLDREDMNSLGFCQRNTVPIGDRDCGKGANQEQEAASTNLMLRERDREIVYLWKIM